jgi:TIR domain
MKVFVSWSGKYSLGAACIIREWLPSVIQLVVPYVSSEDIDKGARWSTDIARELAESNYGIICVTKENLNAPWLNFEAGALSKTLDKSRVTPLLLNLLRSDVQDPLKQFQSALVEKEELFKLLQSINNQISDQKRLSDGALEKAFDMWWPNLEKDLQELKQSHSDPNAQITPPDPQSKILEEMLEILRQQQRILNTPRMLLPPEYFNEIVLRQQFRADSRDFKSGRDIGGLREALAELTRNLSALESQNPEIIAAVKLAAGIQNELNVGSGFPFRRQPHIIDLVNLEGKKE